jgi:hypothetical protein
MRIYSDGEVYLLQHQHNTAQQSPAVIKKVTEENVNDASHFQSKKQVSSFRKFMKEGYTGYYGYIDGKCIHRSWVVPGPARVMLHKFLSLEIQQHEFFIEYCETAPEVRGKNIFAHVLSNIADELKGKKVFIAVDKGNNSSLRSMIKAGFGILEKKRIVVILGIKRVHTLPAS